MLNDSIGPIRLDLGEILYAPNIQTDAAVSPDPVLKLHNRSAVLTLYRTFITTIYCTVASQIGANSSQHCLMLMQLKLGLHSMSLGFFLDHSVLENK